MLVHIYQTTRHRIQEDSNVDIKNDNITLKSFLTEFCKKDFYFSCHQKHVKVRLATCPDGSQTLLDTSNITDIGSDFLDNKM
jgi:hypothetical protein